MSGTIDFDDISFHICIEDGFLVSESVCDSDISSWWTDEGEDDDDDDSEVRLDDANDENAQGTTSCADKQKFTFHRDGKQVNDYDASLTESETDDEDFDDDDNSFGVRKVDMSFNTTSATSNTTNTTLKFSPCCCCGCCCCHCQAMSSSPPVDDVSSMETKLAPISGFELYLAFYFMALVTFLTMKYLPTETQVALQHCNVRKESLRSFQPGENIENASIDVQ
ncbi:hypothetical protein ACHAWU_004774 [Discostella pseudostelligera]|uniref:Uncharacterized protein n=1 Tax=Discostella pseudostelligera TaxID=259834 RepID=A0ABD3N521_9STRA